MDDPNELRIKPRVLDQDTGRGVRSTEDAPWLKTGTTEKSNRPILGDNVTHNWMTKEQKQEILDHRTNMDYLVFHLVFDRVMVKGAVSSASGKYPDPLTEHEIEQIRLGFSRWCSVIKEKRSITVNVKWSGDEKTHLAAATANSYITSPPTGDGTMPDCCGNRCVHKTCDNFNCKTHISCAPQHKYKLDRFGKTTHGKMWLNPRHMKKRGTKTTLPNGVVTTSQDLGNYKIDHPEFPDYELHKLYYVAVHEAGHCLGIGPAWFGEWREELPLGKRYMVYNGNFLYNRTAMDYGLITERGEDQPKPIYTQNPVYRGFYGVAAYNKVMGFTEGEVRTALPLHGPAHGKTQRQPGSDGVHLEDDIPGNRKMAAGTVANETGGTVDLPGLDGEVMAVYLPNGPSYLSEISVGMLKDLGWKVDYGGADKTWSPSSATVDRDCEVGDWETSQGQDPETGWTPCLGSDPGNKITYGKPLRCPEQDGYRWRRRPVVQAKLGNGKDCPNLTETELCRELCPVDCVLSDWGQWSACRDENGEEVDCGGGMRTASRTILEEALHGGECSEDWLTKTEPCATDPCKYECEVSDWIVSDNTTSDGWSFCTVTCGGGMQERHRTITNQPDPGKATKPCPHLTETKGCNTEPCMIDEDYSDLVEPENPDHKDKSGWFVCSDGPFKDPRLSVFSEKEQYMWEDGNDYQVGEGGWHALDYIPTPSSDEWHAMGYHNRDYTIDYDGKWWVHKSVVKFNDDAKETWGKHLLDEKFQPTSVRKGYYGLDEEKKHVEQFQKHLPNMFETGHKMKLHGYEPEGYVPLHDEDQFSRRISRPDLLCFDVSSTEQVTVNVDNTLSMTDGEHPVWPHEVFCVLYYDKDEPSESEKLDLKVKIDKAEESLLHWEKQLDLCLNGTIGNSWMRCLDAEAEFQGCGHRCIKNKVGKFKYELSELRKQLVGLQAHHKLFRLDNYNLGSAQEANNYKHQESTWSKYGLSGNLVAFTVDTKLLNPDTFRAEFDDDSDFAKKWYPTHDKGYQGDDFYFGSNSLDAIRYHCHYIYPDASRSSYRSFENWHHRLVHDSKEQGWAQSTTGLWSESALSQGAPSSLVNPFHANFGNMPFYDINYLFAQNTDDTSRYNSSLRFGNQDPKNLDEAKLNEHSTYKLNVYAHGKGKDRRNSGSEDKVYRFKSHHMGMVTGASRPFGFLNSEQIVKNIKDNTADKIRHKIHERLDQMHHAKLRLQQYKGFRVNTFDEKKMEYSSNGSTKVWLSSNMASWFMNLSPFDSAVSGGVGSTEYIVKGYGEKTTMYGHKTKLSWSRNNETSNYLNELGMWRVFTEQFIRPSETERLPDKIEIYTMVRPMFNIVPTRKTIESSGVNLSAKSKTAPFLGSDTITMEILMENTKTGEEMKVRKQINLNEVT